MKSVIGDDSSISSSLFLLLVFLNFIKDAAIVILISFSYSSTKTIGRALIFYAVLLYGVLPLLMGIMDAPQFFLIPFLTESFISGLLFAIAWIGVIGLLLFRKWNKLKAAQLAS